MALIDECIDNDMVVVFNTWGILASLWCIMGAWRQVGVSRVNLAVYAIIFEQLEEGICTGKPGAM